MSGKDAVLFNGISIHALREEGDEQMIRQLDQLLDFYPRPPRGGRRANGARGGRPRKFLSTPSARRATFHGAGPHGRGDISIHALREEGDCISSQYGSMCSTISIHALREEGDLREFQLVSRISSISIHALREEGDLYQVAHGGF